MPAELKIDGLDILKKVYRRKTRRISEKAMKRVVVQNASELMRTSIRAAPRRFGFLRRSITLELEDGGLTAIVAPYMDYSEYVEFGTRFMRAQPYLGPAFRKQQPIFIKDLMRLVRQK